MFSRLQFSEDSVFIDEEDLIFVRTLKVNYNVVFRITLTYIDSSHFVADCDIQGMENFYGTPIRRDSKTPKGLVF